MRPSSSHGVRAVSELEPSGVAAYSTLRSVLPWVLSHTQTVFALHLYSREPWIPFLLNTSSFLSHCCYTVKLKHSCFYFPLQWGPAGTKKWIVKCSLLHQSCTDTSAVPSSARQFCIHTVPFPFDFDNLLLFSWYINGENTGLSSYWIYNNLTRNISVCYIFLHSEFNTS